MSGARVMLVDDDVDVLGIVAEYLGGLGYRVVACADGGAALARLGAGGPAFDAAVVDWSLPDLPGLAVVRELHARHPGCAVIVTTGHGAEVLTDVAAAGVKAAVLRKPFTMRSLAIRLEAELSRS